MGSRALIASGTPRRMLHPGRARFLLLLGSVSLLASLVAARVQGPGGPWLWNFDMPFWDYPVASFFHDALSHGRLPMWNDQLGLGFPLYAEGQIGAFYPLNWLIFQFPPLVALDIVRVTHLTILGVGTGVLAFRLSGSRLGAVFAAAAMVLCGGIVSKLEWTNLVEGFAWLPWMLIPLVRWPHPTRTGLVASGATWGLIALAGHPNVWLLAGLTAAIVLLTIRPRLDTIGRLVGLGLVAVAVGAVQLIPTALLWSMSLRSAGLTPDDLFRSTGMPFDVLGTAFANVFVKAQQPALDLNSSWYPGGGWAPAEMGSYVGLPLLALAAPSFRRGRARPLIVVAIFMILFPLVAGLRLSIWSALPVWNAIHAPVKGYVVLDLMLVLMAAMTIGRLQRHPVSWRPAAAIAAIFVGAYLALAALVFWAPAQFVDLVRHYWSFPPPDQAPVVLQNAQDTLGRWWPVVFEIGVAVTVIALP